MRKKSLQTVPIYISRGGFGQSEIMQDERADK